MTYSYCTRQRILKFERNNITKCTVPKSVVPIGLYAAYKIDNSDA